MTLPPRSVLYLPASSPRAMEKLRSLPCDAAILDLEDAVAPEAKDDARAAAVAALGSGGFGGRTVAVRINAHGTPWHAADLAALAAVPADAVVLPKVEAAAAVTAVAGAVGRPIWAMIETARGVVEVGRIAAATGLAGLIAGTNDLALDLRARPDAARTPLLPALSAMVIAARAHRLLVLDGVMNAIDEPDRLAAECAQGRMLGFDGKTLIHPAQIAAANAAFSPDAGEVAAARAVMAAFAAPEAAGRGAIRLDGRMVERLHLAEAERVVAAAERDPGATASIASAQP